MEAELLEQNSEPEQKLDEITLAILVAFDERGEASVGLHGVTPQQILTAGALLTTMAQHLLDVRFEAEEQRQAQSRLQQMLLTQRVSQDLKKGRGR